MSCCGVTVAQAAALEALSGHGPMRLKELGQRLGIAPSTLTRNLERLIEAGLVARQSDSQGRALGARAPDGRRPARGDSASRGASDDFAKQVLDRIPAGRRAVVLDSLAELLTAVRGATEACCPGAFDHLMEGFGPACGPGECDCGPARTRRRGDGGVTPGRIERRTRMTNTTTTGTGGNEGIVTQVKKRYAEIAVTGSSCCGAGCPRKPPDCCARDTTAPGISQELGYSASDLAGVPKEADLGLGCGVPLGHLKLEAGETVVDLGSGPGLDALLAAKQVGNTGRVIGVDMTPEMLERARATAAKVGATNVDFRQGRLEHAAGRDRERRRRHQQLRDQPGARQGGGLRRDRARAEARRARRRLGHRARPAPARGGGQGRVRLVRLRGRRRPTASSTSPSWKPRASARSRS